MIKCFDSFEIKPTNEYKELKILEKEYINSAIYNEIINYLYHLSIVDNLKNITKHKNPLNECGEYSFNILKK
jgi:hypothetical protein